MRIVFDIDGTICKQMPAGEYDKAEPYVEIVEKIKSLRKMGHAIIFFTARGMGQFNGDVKKADDTWRKVTEDQLRSWGLECDELIFGKPHADVYVDDRAVVAKDGKIWGDL